MRRPMTVVALAAMSIPLALLAGPAPTSAREDPDGERGPGASAPVALAVYGAAGALGVAGEPPAPVGGRTTGVIVRTG